MPGPCSYDRPRRIRRGAALTLFLAGVLATGAATGTWSEDGRGAERPAPAGAASGGRVPEAATADRAAVERAASEAVEDGKSGAQAAADVVSRSGDRWSTIYSAGEFKDFQAQLDGGYVGVGLWVRQASHGRIEVSRVQPGGPPRVPVSRWATGCAPSTAARPGAHRSPRSSPACGASPPAAPVSPPPLPAPP